ncbi:MAG TPA: spermidine/putrescine ABC transporter substrate-binding protein [Acidimicrobiia bacterium]|nr:spermidine/putrescine ABC transporter substrate-binding protein [Acidimicrobiia bacterium]
MTDDRVSIAFIADANSPRFNRRRFMKTMAFVAGAGVAVAACGGSDSDSSSSGPGATVAPDATEAKTLNFYNWTDYVAPDEDGKPGTISAFEKETGIKVTYDTYDSNDVLLQKMESGGTGFDLIVPTDSYIPRLKQGDLVQALNLSLIPNLKNVDQRFRDAEYDPGNELSIPWQWGTTGLGFDPTQIKDGEVTDWDAFDLASVKGKATYLNEARDAFGMALIALGYDPNTTDDTQLDEATDWLIAKKKNLKSISSNYKTQLESGEIVLAQAYSGDVFQAQVNNDKLEYAIPSSGAFQWVDVMMIPKDAKHPKNAHAFMNYILTPEAGAALTNFTYYGTPNKAALPLIDKEIIDDPLINPPADVVEKLYFQKDLGEDEFKYSDRWTKVTTA